MSNSNGKIASPVDLIADVCKVIACSTPMLQVVCKSENINLFSKAKPVDIANTPFPNRSGKWWQGTDMNCGLQPYVLDSYRQLISSPMGGNAGWKHIPPKGGAASPFRQMDFNGYDQLTPCVVSGWTCPEEVKRGARIYSILNLNMLSGHDVIELSDIMLYGKWLSDWHLGMMVVSNPNISNDGGEIMSICAGTNGCETMHLGDSKTYTVYPFWSYEEIEWNWSLLEGSLIDPVPMGTNKVITIPNCVAKQVKILPASGMMGVQILITPVKYFDRIHVEVNIYCESATTLQSLVISKRFSTNTEMTGMQVGEEQHTSSGLPTTVVAGQKYTYTWDFYEYDDDRQYKIWARLTTNKSSYVESADVI